MSAILYELLYERVFGMDQPVRVALDMISSKPFLVHASSSSSSADGNTDKTGYVVAFVTHYQPQRR